MTQTKSPTWIDVEAAALYAGVAPQTIRNWIADDDVSLRTKDIDAKTHVRTADLEKADTRDDETRAGWFTPQRAAAHTGLSLSTMFRRMRGGTYRTKRFGRALRVWSADLPKRATTAAPRGRR